MVDADDLAELAKMTEPPEHMQHSSLGTGIERLFVSRPPCALDSSRGCSGLGAGPRLQLRPPLVADPLAGTGRRRRCFSKLVIIGIQCLLGALSAQKSLLGASETSQAHRFRTGI